jgi:hypothetical protein
MFCAVVVRVQLTKGKVQLQKGLSLAQPKQETAKVNSDGKKVQHSNCDRACSCLTIPVRVL